MVTMEQKLAVIPLGGLGEVGKNIMAIKYGEDIIVIDCGLMFPEEEMFGVDVVIPDVSYLIENKQNIRGIILTHGHDDHIGAIPYLLDNLNVPIYGTSLTLGLLEAKLQEDWIKEKASLNLVKPGKRLKLGEFNIDFIPVNHSIPDAVGLFINTPIGNIIHTGDFKLDQTPMNGDVMIHQFAKFGGQKILLLMCDSMNVERPGFTPSEKVVGAAFERVFTQAESDRIIIATSAVNVYRLQQIVNVAKKYKRKLVIHGKKVEIAIETAMRMKKLHLPDGLLITNEQAKAMENQKLVVLTAGDQGDPLLGLNKLSTTHHKQLQIGSGDTVIVPSSNILGNEKTFSRTIDSLFKLGAKVIYDNDSGVHVSGHASQEELKIMLTLIKPKYFLPIHGDYRQLVRHKRLAQEVGLQDESIFVLENGHVLEIGKDKANVNGRVKAGKILVDGLGIGDVGNIVLRDRRQLSQDGIFIIVVTINKKTGKAVAGPDMVSRGFVYVRESEQLMEDAKAKVASALEHCNEKKLSEWADIKSNIREVLGKFLFEKTRRRPMIMPIIMEV